MPGRLKVFFDGGRRGDPATMEIAVVARGRTTILADLGHGTSGDAEWLAAIHALEVARALGARDVVLIGDTADVIAKIGGAAACRGGEARHLERFRALAATMNRCGVRRVKRSQNLAGIALASRHPR